ncbi:MAG: LlaJI family restriction endonuclease [Pseudoxanthomonas suwonensis]|nr:LlaJI family restriction endonuclease [Pseudoxanthomonas suwonensis]
MTGDHKIEWLREGALWPETEDQELRGLLAEEGALRSSPAGRLAVRFVGVIIHGQRTLIALPKIRTGAPSAMVHRYAMRAMRRYERWTPTHHELSPYLNESPEKGRVSALAATDWLVRDYLEHGLLRRADVTQEIDGPGIVNWRQTVQGITPILSRGVPLYLKTITRRTEDNNRSFATRLHLYLLERLSQQYGQILDLEPVILDHEPVERLDSLPSFEECEALIALEQRATYSQRGLELLAMMLATVSSLEIETSRGLSLYGTSNFHYVWEEACAHSFRNQRDEWLRSLPHPVWTSVTGQSSTARTFVPDLVVSIAPTDLLIGDAKYYQPRMPPFLGGVPGVNDVGKQIWYKQRLHREADRRGYDQIHNAFLFPSDTQQLANFGWVEMPVGDEAVDAVGVPFLPALAAYSGDLEQPSEAWCEDIANILAANSIARARRVAAALGKALTGYPIERKVSTKGKLR